MTLQEAIDLVKQNGLVVCNMAAPGTPIPEPREGELWVAPSPRVSPRSIAMQKDPWVIDFYTSGDALQGRPRGSFMAWARRTGARPVVEVLRVQEPVAEPQEQAPLPLWRRLLGRGRK